MRRIHQPHDRDIDRDMIRTEMALHSVKSLDEYFISGEVITEFVFRRSVLVILSVRQAAHFIYFSKKTAKVQK